MTAVLQLTDTDVSFPLKSAAKRAKHELKREMRARAASCGETASFRCGPLEILRIAYESHMAVKELNERENLVLAGLRRNSTLSLRPCLRTRRTVRSDTQDWCKNLPEGSHRYPRSWLEHRYEWQTPEGVPMKPTWEKCGANVKEAEDMEDYTNHGPESCKVKLSCWGAGTELGEGVEEPLVSIECDQEKLDLKLNVEIANEAKAALVAEFVDSVVSKTEDNGRKATDKKRRKLQRQAMRNALRTWRQEQRKLLNEYSRQ